MAHRTIPQRELRNNVAAVLREAEGGTVFTVTVRGRPVARLGPPEEKSGPKVDVERATLERILAMPLDPRRSPPTSRQPSLHRFRRRPLAGSLSGVLLDTSRLIASLEHPAPALPEQAAISVITIGELRAGVLLAREPLEGAKRQARLEQVRSAFLALPVD